MKDVKEQISFIIIIIILIEFPITSSGHDDCGPCSCGRDKRATAHGFGSRSPYPALVFGVFLFDNTLTPIFFYKSCTTTHKSCTITNAWFLFFIFLFFKFVFTFAVWGHNSILDSWAMRPLLLFMFHTQLAYSSSMFGYDHVFDCDCTPPIKVELKERCWPVVRAGYPSDSQVNKKKDQIWGTIRKSWKEHTIESTCQ